MAGFACTADFKAGADAVSLLAAFVGRTGGAGGGGRLRRGSVLPLPLKFFCLLRAAMRSAKVLN
jgi:hypothetical protein